MSPNEPLITRRKALVALGAGAIAVPLGLSAQPRKKIPLVGVLHPGAPTPPTALIVALQQGLREIGYVEGQTIAIEYRHAQKADAMPGFALELVKLKVDVFVAVTISSISAAKAVAGTIPIVATDLQIDPVAGGLATSLAKPGGNVTGLFLDFPPITGKWLELLRETVPGMKRVAVLWDMSSGSDQLDALASVAKGLSIELEVAKFQLASEIEGVLTTALKRRAQALVQLSSPVVNQASARVAKLINAKRLPSISMFSAFPEAGGLMSFGPDPPVFWRRIAPLVDKILKGAKPGTIPIERPTTFQMVVNMKTANALGITIPPTVLVRADRVLH